MNLRTRNQTTTKNLIPKNDGKGETGGASKQIVANKGTGKKCKE